tara:strand:+ start:1038 stop:1235 length:198 start_codon:yes stop_codon:yes gene_type:complete
MHHLEAPALMLISGEMPLAAQPLKLGELLRKVEGIGVRLIGALAAFLDAPDGTLSFQQQEEEDEQ